MPKEDLYGLEMKNTHSPSRRTILGWGLAGLAVAGLAGRELAAPTSKPRRLGHWNLATEELGRFLSDHPNKIVVAFSPRNSADVTRFYRSSDFWQMLKENDFHNHFADVSVTQQPFIDLASEQPQGISMGQDRSRIYYQAKQQGISTTAIHVGPQETSDPYTDLIEQEGKAYRDTLRMTAGQNDVTTEINQQASFFRSQANSRTFRHFREDSEVANLQRLNDDATVENVRVQMATTSGKVWLTSGIAHATDCGIHTKLDDCLVLEVYATRQEMLRIAAERQNSDIYVQYAERRYPGPYYVVILDKGQISFVPGSPDMPRQERQQACQEAMQKPDDIRTVLLSSASQEFGTQTPQPRKHNAHIKKTLLAQRPR